MKRTLSLPCALVALALAGCGAGGSEMTKQELNALEHPSKTIPPEAAAGMAKMGELMKKQQDANKAAGVDGRGIPLALSGDKAAPPTTK